MSNRRIGQTPFKDILPGSIANDETIGRISDCLDSLFQKSVRFIPNELIFARLAHDSGFINPVPMLAPMERIADMAGGLKLLETQILDLLAWQLHVESYNAGVSLQAKREMLQASLILHRRNGTPWSVRHALETLLRVPATIRQWFEYGGDPYFFRARLNVSGVPVDIRWLQSAFQIVYDYKNVRSWLEWLETFTETVLTVHTGIGVGGVVKERNMLFFPFHPMPKMQNFAGAGTSTRTVSYLGLHFPGQKPELQINTGIGPRIRTKARLEYKNLAA